MTDWTQLIAELGRSVHKEIEVAPDLLADMAKLEGYLAESYHQRTFIELIQNADDALSHRAYCVIREQFVIFANDGREFAEQDLRSICRSGASLKAAEQNKIGYRGIGFKSTLNLGESIHIFSGSLAFTFSRDLTERSLGSQRVPTVRMPHPLVVSAALKEQVLREVSRLRQDGYGTLFVFETSDSSKASKEFAALKGEDLLFLAHLAELTMDAEGDQLRVTLERKAVDLGTRISIRLTDTSSNWLVISKETDAATAVAFPVDAEGSIEGARLSPQPVHCFLPTLEASGFGFRVNGRFSTDPTRTRIEFDENTRLALEDVTSLLIGLISRLAHTNSVPSQFTALFTVLVAPVGFSRFGERMRVSLLAKAKVLTWLPHFAPAKRPIVRPEWLSPAEFSSLIETDDLASQNLARLDAAFPSFGEFLRECGLTTLQSKDVISKSCCLSEHGRGETIVQVVKEVRSGSTSVLAAGFERALLWTQQSGDIASLTDATANLSDRTRLYLAAKLSSAEVAWVNDRWRLDLDDASEAVAPKLPREVESSPIPFERRLDARNLKRWRTVEQNMVELIGAQLGGAVSDVSQSNLGYDLEVHYGGGRREYVEVKSVTRSSCEFVLTNNEYAQASLAGTSYILALCCLEENLISWTLVRDPVRTLQLTRRCSRWEWVSNVIPKLVHMQKIR